MNLLILGGTIFLGRHLVEAALERGHVVTLFNRGQSNPDLFPEVERLHGDRDGKLDALAGRRWDAVIDTCGYVPRVVKASAELLAGTVEHYTFISSISVYPHPMPPFADETSPVATLEDETVEEVTGDTYGALKALCEQAVEAALPGRALNIRPGLIVGPHDPSDRLTYWPVRIASGGDIAVPDRFDMPVQIIDARDLAGWTLDAVEQHLTGVYNATGPATPLTFGEVLAACQAISDSPVQLHAISESFLEERGVAPWTGLPLWLPPEYDSMSQTSIDKALAAGLIFRPLLETLQDTLAWAQSRPEGYEWRSGLSRKDEQELIAAWQANQP